MQPNEDIKRAINSVIYDLEELQNAINDRETMPKKELVSELDHMIAQLETIL